MLLYQALNFLRVDLNNVELKRMIINKSLSFLALLTAEVAEQHIS